ncbi:MAG: DNA repair protein RecN [Actinomycetia bacterium]|nr:DNA repair protein RecN [Actinomycetes bacterium]
MLDELQVRDYALIADANLNFASGLTAISGETGAGKTALVGAIKLLVGERADSLAVRDGADELRVAARLTDADGQELIISRRLSRQGRSRCSINDEMATVAALAQTTGPLFDLLGQHEHQSLLSAADQMAYLDRFAGNAAADALSGYQAAWHQAEMAAAELDGLRSMSASTARNLDEATFVLARINAVAPEEGEYQRLLADLPVLRGGEELFTGATAAWELLRQEGSVLDRLAEAARILEPLVAIDQRLAGMPERLSAAQVDLDDLAQSLRAYQEEVNFDPDALDHALDRIGQLESLVKQFGPGIDEVFAARSHAEAQLGANDTLPERLQCAELALQQAEAELATAAAALTAVRSEAAKSLAINLNSRLDGLAMVGTHIEAALSELPRTAWAVQGAQRFELLYCPDPRSKPRPLAKIASGGEISRVMLALKSALVDASSQTLVFDEVDAGVGGEAARAVASYIRQTATVHQVIVVTHLAQIAALADKHYVVEKTVSETGSQTKIRELDGEERVAEIARMLSGSQDAIARQHARELLSEAASGTGAAGTRKAPGQAAGSNSRGSQEAQGLQSGQDQLFEEH